MQKKDNINLLEAEAAVEDFLDTLLQESTEYAVVSKPLKTKPRLLLIPELDLAPPVTEVEEKLMVDEAPLPPALETGLQVQQSVTKVDANDYQFPLQCLMFTVAENVLSIPLINMGSVIPWGDRLTVLPDSPDWFLGLLKHRDENVKVADTAKVVQIKENNKKASGQRHILVFAGNSWAITCDKLGDVINLNEDDVQWSKPDSTGLALGTIKDSLAILLNPAKILNQLNRNEE